MIDKFSDRIDDAADDARKQGKDVAGQAKGRFNDAEQQGRGMADQAKDKMNRGKQGDRGGGFGEKVSDALSDDRNR